MNEGESGSLDDILSVSQSCLFFPGCGHGALRSYSASCCSASVKKWKNVMAMGISDLLCTNSCGIVRKHSSWSAPKTCFFLYDFLRYWCRDQRSLWRSRWHCCSQGPQEKTSEFTRHPLVKHALHDAVLIMSLMHLRKALREKYGIEDKMVLPFEPVSWSLKSVPFQAWLIQLTKSTHKYKNESRLSFRDVFVYVSDPYHRDPRFRQPVRSSAVWWAEDPEPEWQGEAGGGQRESLPKGILWRRESTYWLLRMKRLHRIANCSQLLQPTVDLT